MRLCGVDELKKRGSLEVVIATEDEPKAGFVVYREGEVRAYLNHCPHTGAPLNWAPHVFLSIEGTHIQCALHGALFRIEDGYCVFGPCNGESLTPVAIELVGDDILLATE